MKIVRNFQSGFTLIELLVVIGILGILAGTLFFTINPIEQLRRGGDASKKTAAENFVTAANSYNSIQRTYPWDTDGANCNNSVALASTPLASGTTVNACVTTLVDNGDLKATFDDDTNTLSDLVVTGNANSFAICFLPESEAEQNSPQAKYTSAGVESSSCTPGTSCYWCLVQ